MKSIVLAGLVAANLLRPAVAAPAEAVRDLTYKTTPSGPLQLSLHLPAAPAAGARPLVVWVHGGAWHRGSKDELPTSNPNLYAGLLQRGYAIASLNYRLSGQASFPAPMQDIQDALNFLADEAPALGIEADSVVLAGRSAGGHLALLAGLANSHPTPDFLVPPRYRVRAIVSFFGPTDLLIHEPSLGRADRQPGRSPTARLLGAVPAEAPALARQASPISYVTPQSAPTLLLHGRQDMQVPLVHSLTLQGALQAHGVPNALRIEDEAGHSARVFDSQAHVPAVLDFIARHLPSPRP